MHKTRLYIIQTLGIILLIAGYFLRDRPDSESVMHFNTLSSHAVYTSNDDGYQECHIATYSGESHGHHRLRFVKHFSFKVFIPSTPFIFQYKPLTSVDYITPFAENYYFLFFKEINPPPPKVC